MKYHYYLVAVAFSTVIFLFSCSKRPDLPASASLLIVKPMPLQKNTAIKENGTGAENDGKTVWICQSAASKRYHFDASCRGLKKCTHTILKTTVRKAKAVGLTICVFEN